MWAKTLILFSLGPAGVLWGQETREQIPAQAQRGLELFAQRKCSTCHRLGGNGTAIAPDLTTIARLSPRAIKLMVLATRTELVIAVHLKNGDTMPAIRVSDDGKTLQCYDLAKDPPVLRSIEKSQIVAVKDNEKWQHPPASTDLDEQRLADIIAYIRWASYRDRKGVDPADVR